MHEKVMTSRQKVKAHIAQMSRKTYIGMGVFFVMSLLSDGKYVPSYIPFIIAPIIGIPILRMYKEKIPCPHCGFNLFSIMTFENKRFSRFSDSIKSCPGCGKSID